MTGNPARAAITADRIYRTKAAPEFGNSGAASTFGAYAARKSSLHAVLKRHSLRYSAMACRKAEDCERLIGSLVSFIRTISVFPKRAT